MVEPGATPRQGDVPEGSRDARWKSSLLHGQPIARCSPRHCDSSKFSGRKVCIAFPGKLMINLQVNRFELDGVWSFVKKKRPNVEAEDPRYVGDR